eukprot:CAMPEP_0171563764 /NCGR_PEP_ID=MMETSP0960-20121227/15897_1 /TAXON_ID=87120 /ORGANISM="Aurantiochytrium limacinum, Strain ATCCMYA-1381" /LENGTH=169 /DNA_ID=CAMNT_0012117039 /DNA_START=164 /DNA_END=674 /DNA_ORIENTATION=-
MTNSQVPPVADFAGSSIRCSEPRHIAYLAVQPKTKGACEARQNALVTSTNDVLEGFWYELAFFRPLLRLHPSLKACAGQCRVPGIAIPPLMRDGQDQVGGLIDLIAPPVEEYSLVVTNSHLAPQYPAGGNCRSAEGALEDLGLLLVPLLQEQSLHERFRRRVQLCDVPL